MTISGALSAALSGLTANSRAASVVSANVANAGTDGYGVREVHLAALTYGAGYGVHITGIDRVVDPVLLGERRAAEASLGETGTRAHALQRIETLIGSPDDANSLSAHLAEFEAQLVGAASRPDSQARLEAVLQSANRLVTRINDVSDGIQSTRLQADRDIAANVEVLNRTIAEIDDLNRTIRTAVSRGDSALGLIDKQQSLIDGIAELVPIREVRDQTGMVNIYSADGIALLDGSAAQFGFTASAAITPGMTLENGDLSGLTINGRAVATTDTYGSLSGGKLAGLFAIRDEIGVKAQAEIDGVALDLTSRLDSSTIDLTIGASSPGLFTDAGVLSSATYETGLAARLRLNAAVDPAQGGALWRIRDGVGATAEGNPGDPTLLNNILLALQNEQTTASTAFSSTTRTMAELVSDQMSLAAMDRQFADADSSHANGSYLALREAELRGGVDTDAQMQRLLEIEKAYAANARVISTIDEMLDQLMRL